MAGIRSLPVMKLRILRWSWGDVKSFIRATDQKFDLFRPKKVKSIATAYCEKASLERLELPRNSIIKHVFDIKINKFPPIGIGNRPFLSTGTKGDLYRFTVPLNLDHKVLTKCFLYITVVLKELSQTLSKCWTIFRKVIQGTPKRLIRR
ncbi:hypothetical protein CIHG_03620 [Coccidioides immitis H538.4]|uniref:Uncharacterized protein n=1 Tax=Coccidioides immitis H538.4 TaxID=396776 RepID=A0A0J8RNJ3_COCIT|nr:hypothetical protein CIHG_03620 [Coccidioides immitis H538.4]